MEASSSSQIEGKQPTNAPSFAQYGSRAELHGFPEPNDGWNRYFQAVANGRNGFNDDNANWPDFKLFNEEYDNNMEDTGKEPYVNIEWQGNEIYCESSIKKIPDRNDKTFTIAALDLWPKTLQVTSKQLPNDDGTDAVSELTGDKLFYVEEDCRIDKSPELPCMFDVARITGTMVDDWERRAYRLGEDIIPRARGMKKPQNKTNESENMKTTITRLRKIFRDRRWAYLQRINGGIYNGINAYDSRFIDTMNKLSDDQLILVSVFPYSIFLCAVLIP
jgi:hypothetical protein